MGALILLVAGIVGVVLYFRGYKTPPAGMSEENKEKFNNANGLGAWIGIIIVVIVLNILCIPNLFG